MIWIVLIGFVAAIFFTMGLDRLSHRLGYGSRGTLVAAVLMMVVGFAGLYLMMTPA